MIGLGPRGRGLLKCILQMDDVEVIAVCDEFEERIELFCKRIADKNKPVPFVTKNYRELLAIAEVEAVIISAAWEAHVELAVAAMRAGKYVGLEVGGAYSVDDCWKLVRTSEETGIPCMMLENCCYGQKELLCLNMAKKGLFGEIVHCEGAYHHDVRNEILNGLKTRHYRLRNYIARNCENYPTHELGPIAKLLNINRGNRMLSLVSMASKSAGLHEYVTSKGDEYVPLLNTQFAQGDIVTTIIRCAGGETITLKLGTTLPRFYSRCFTVHGTRGYYEEHTNSVFLESDKESYGEDCEENWKPNWDNAKTRYHEQYGHPLWKKYLQEGIKAGHGGMDWLVLRAFFESAIEGVEPPIDVYDAAAWMCISALSEQSIAMGGAPVPIPDFTNGKWIKGRTCKMIETYRLDTIPEEVCL